MRLEIVEKRPSLDFEAIRLTPGVSSPWVGVVTALLLAFLSVGCRCESKEGAAGASSAGARLPPLAASSWLLELPVPGFGAASVGVPLGARTPRPGLIALHGDDDRPEWQCGSYHYASARRALILCPRGVPRPGGDRFTLGSVERTSQELRALLPALKSHFGVHLAKGPVVLTAIGPSVGHAIDIAREEPSFFSYLVLVDGKLDRLTRAVVSRYAAAGGKRVLFVCTRVGCDPELAGKVLALRSGGVDSRALQLPQATGLDGVTVAALRKEWDWLVKGDARWR